MRYSYLLYNNPSFTMEVSNVVATINKAKTYRNTESPLIIHSHHGWALSNTKTMEFASG